MSDFFCSLSSYFTSYDGPLYILTGTSLILSFVYLLKWLSGSRQTVRGIPHPLRLPIIGNLWCLGVKTHESFAQLAEKFGGRYKVGTLFQSRPLSCKILQRFYIMHNHTAYRCCRITVMSRILEDLTRSELNWTSCLSTFKIKKSVLKVRFSMP